MVQNIKQTGYGLREMAELLGKRGCCKKKTCFHRKAYEALKRIDELENLLLNIKSTLSYHIKRNEDITVSSTIRIKDLILKLEKGKIE